MHLQEFPFQTQKDLLRFAEVNLLVFVPLMLRGGTTENSRAHGT